LLLPTLGLECHSLPEDLCGSWRQLLSFVAQFLGAVFGSPLALRLHMVRLLLGAVPLTDAMSTMRQPESKRFSDDPPGHGNNFSGEVENEAGNNESENSL